MTGDFYDRLYEMYGFYGEKRIVETLLGILEMVADDCEHSDDLPKANATRHNANVLAEAIEKMNG